MKIFKKKAGRIALLQTFATIALVGVIGTTVAVQNAGVINQYFGQDPHTIIHTDGSESPVYFDSDYKTMEELQQDETLFAEQVQAEGSVLLQNKNLPLTNAKKITLLGSGSSDDAFYVGGGGSGAIDRTQTPSLKSVFEAAGYELNPTMLAFYERGALRAPRYKVSSLYHATEERARAGAGLPLNRFCNARPVPRVIASFCCQQRYRGGMSANVICSL